MRFREVAAIGEVEPRRLTVDSRGFIPLLEGRLSKVESLFLWI